MISIKASRYRLAAPIPLFRKFISPQKINTQKPFSSEIGTYLFLSLMAITPQWQLMDQVLL